MASTNSNTGCRDGFPLASVFPYTFTVGSSYYVVVDSVIQAAPTGLSSAYDPDMSLKLMTASQYNDWMSSAANT